MAEANFSIQITVDDSALRRFAWLIAKSQQLEAISPMADLKQVYKRLGEIWEARHG